MLVRDEVEKAVRLQACGYQLLIWMEKAMNDGFIAPEAAGNYATSEDAAYAWLDRHYLNLPDRARPERSELRDFSNFFSTYLDSTFDLHINPGRRLYSDHYCFCPVCSWMVKRPYLRPKKVRTQDKRVAEKMKRTFLIRLANTQRISPSDDLLTDILQDPELREPVGLCTYTVDLLERLRGTVHGAASLVLWRSFAWTSQGSPKKDFVLTTDNIMMAQELLVQRLAGSASLR